MKSQMLIETVCVLAGASVRVHVSESTDVCRHTTRKLYTNAYLLLYILEGARASTGLSLLCVDVGYKHWSNDRPLCA